MIKKLAEAARYNSGRHFLDSGDHYGRHYEKGPISENDPAIKIELWGENEVMATIETVAFLSEKCEHLDYIQNQFDEFAADLTQSWFECGQAFCELKGYELKARDNTYNNENDLSQDYVWEIWDDPNPECDDWIYSDSAILVVYIHTGCDIRGGYSFPVFLKCTDYDYSLPIDTVVGWNLCDASIDGEEIMDNYEFDEEFQVGNSSNPSYQLNKEIDFVFAPWSVNHGYVLAKLNNGVIGKFYPEIR
jgi:hypothetical protein